MIDVDTAKFVNDDRGIQKTLEYAEADDLKYTMH